MPEDLADAHILICKKWNDCLCDTEISHTVFKSVSFFFLFLFFPPTVDLDPCDPGLSLSAGRSVMAEPDYMDEDCDELIKPKKLINPVKTSRNHQDLHRELLMNQKRSADRKIPWIALLAVTWWPHVENPKHFFQRDYLPPFVDTNSKIIFYNGS